MSLSDILILVSWVFGSVVGLPVLGDNLSLLSFVLTFGDTFIIIYGDTKVKSYFQIKAINQYSVFKVQK